MNPIIEQLKAQVLARAQRAIAHLDLVDAFLSEPADEVSPLKTDPTHGLSFGVTESGEAKESPVKVKKQKPTKSPKKLSSYHNAKAVGLADAIRAVFADDRKTMSRMEVADAIIKKFPEMRRQTTSLAVALIDMAGRGELTRNHAGRAATYTPTNALRQCRDAKMATLQTIRDQVVVKENPEEGK